MMTMMMIMIIANQFASVAAAVIYNTSTRIRRQNKTTKKN